MRALLSVFDKTGLSELAEALVSLGFELVATGGTAEALASSGIPHVRVEQVTGAPELLGGRVKTLHPAIHAAILADREDPSHLEQLEAHGIGPIDLVVCNLYPFAERPSVETIDIGGPAMVRAAAKNHAHVAVLVEPDDYGPVLDELRSTGALSPSTRRRLAQKAFAHTASYDAEIARRLTEGDLPRAFLGDRRFEDAGPDLRAEPQASFPAPGGDDPLPERLEIVLERVELLRYGENPHQRAARYRRSGSEGWWDRLVQHGGLALSYVNLLDAEAAWRLVHEIARVGSRRAGGLDGDGRPAAVIVKHANPCGAAVADDPVTAYRLAIEGDRMSAFGGIVALNRPITEAVAAELAAGPQADVVIAPGYEPRAVDALLARRKNTRVLEAPPPGPPLMELRSFTGGYLLQEPDRIVADPSSWKVVTKRAPTETQWADLELAWRVCAATTSNAIVLVIGGQAVGIGAGQQNRVDPGLLAVRKAAGRAVGGVAASDAFFPFRDGLDAVAEAGVAAVVQPGGSVRDAEVIAAADERGIAMVFTGERHFRH